ASFFSRSARGSRMRLTRALAFVPVERSLRPRLGLFAPLRDKVTSSAQSLVPFRSTQPRIEPINPNRTARCTRRASLDPLVGGDLQCQRHLEAERLGSLEVDHQLELGRLNNRQVCRLLALENPAGVNSRLTKYVGDAGSIADEAAGRDKLAQRVNRGYRVVRRQRRKFIAPADKERIGKDHQRASSLLSQRREGCVDLLVNTRGQGNGSPAERMRRVLYISRLGPRVRIGRVCKHSNHSGPRHQLAQ